MNCFFNNQSTAHVVRLTCQWEEEEPRACCSESCPSCQAALWGSDPETS